MKAIPLAISDFAVPSPRSGSIETYSGFGALPMVGTEIHALVQIQRQKDFSGYQVEKWVTYGFNCGDGNRVNVSGRMDGFLSGQPAWIEEIKSAYNPDQLVKALEKNPDHPYRLQALTYGYIHYKLTGEIPRVSLHIVSSRTKQGFDFELTLDVAHYEAWLSRRLAEIVLDAKMFKKLHARREKSSQAFAFPFAEPRAGQIDLMKKVEECVTAKKALLVQAPTGLGKTAGVLFPALKEAFSRGQKVIYLTPKNSQHAVAEDAVKRLQAAGTKVKAVTIQAKTKMCFKEQVLCNPEYCEFARDYYKKVADNDLINKVAKKKNMSSQTFRKFGCEYEVCPAELQMDTLHRADVVICDYNYVFSPRNSLAKVSNNGFEKKTQPNLVIDEVHNLPQRANDYFSAAISDARLLELQPGFSHLSEDLYRQAQELFREGRQLIEVSGAGARQPVKVELNKERFFEFGARVSGFLANYLESPSELQLGDAVLKFCNLWAEFITALENLTEEFFTTFTPDRSGGGTLKITCCDASSWLLEGYNAFQNVVAFSATVKPFDYYAKLLGLDQKPLVTAEFFSPFPKEHRKLLIVPQVSTKYSDREANYPKIREGIQRILALKPGNYFAFFPSFAFLSRVAEGLDLPGFEILQQAREMRRKDVEGFLDSLRIPNKPTLIMAVQGGVFAEGVDYPGDMLIGAIVVGPALPTFDFERELLRGYFAKKHGEENGFDYAYTYPAMAKVVQSAGRVIRSHEDLGLIVLMDRRFVHGNYMKSMPADWVGDDPHNHISKSLLSDIREFWESHES